jgi:VanZ family protein
MKSFFWVISEIVLIFILLSLPGNQLPHTDQWWRNIPIDKAIHIVLFCSLMYSLLYYYDQTAIKFLKTTRAKAFTMIVCIVYGIAMEFYQKNFVPSRGFEVADMLADAAGVLVALPLYQKLQKGTKA